MTDEPATWCEQARQRGISPLDWLAVWQDKTLADIEAMPPDELKVQLRRWMTIARECLEDGEEKGKEMAREELMRLARNYDALVADSKEMAA